MCVNNNLAMADTPSLDDILCRLPLMKVSSTSESHQAGHVSYRKSLPPTFPQSSTRNLDSFDEWIDYLSSKATSGIEPKHPKSYQTPVSPSSITLSFDKLLDRFTQEMEKGHIHEAPPPPPPPPPTPTPFQASSSDTILDHHFLPGSQKNDNDGPDVRDENGNYVLSCFLSSSSCHFLQPLHL